MLRVAFGGNTPGPGPSTTTLALPVLAGAAVETFAGGDLRFGVEIEPIGRGIEAATAALYRRLLEGIGGRHLCRIWNYVPAINMVTGEPPLENYRAFSRARSRAFEAAWGEGFARRLPAASAVGGEPDRLVAVFATSSAVPSAIENPEQLPAYEYPDEHGPRPPSFSRAMRVADAASDWLFVSGTAAIKGHRTIAPNELLPQIECTLDNLAIIGSTAGVGPDLGASQKWRRRFKVYLRHASDLPEARAALERQLLRPGDETVWLHADICRAELLIEIEATLSRDPANLTRHPARA